MSGFFGLTTGQLARADQGNTFTQNQTAPQWISNAPQGTPPLQVTSSTAVSNLNADLLDGQHASAFVQKSGDTMTGPLTFGNFSIQFNATTNSLDFVYTGV